MNKIRVGILFGGRSAEHQVSLLSAKNIIEAIDKEKYEVVPIGIDKNGQWHAARSNNCFNNPNDPKIISLNVSDEPFVLTADHHLDVVFPVLHGTNGEDGTVQGLLTLLGVPFVGAGVLGSAIGMDKDVTKRLLKAAGLPVVDWLTVVRDRPGLEAEAIVAKLGLPLFVKPANAGSSVGVTKVKSLEALWPAIESAFHHDRKVLIEQAVIGREIECSVLGNEQPVTSVPGEVVVHREFYSYEAKYLDPNAATIKVPADLPEAVVKQVQELAIATFQTLEGSGLARVDFFLAGDQLYINEINTMPGFTNRSMYPELWQASGLSYPDLIDRLIELALQRHSTPA